MAFQSGGSGGAWSGAAFASSSFSAIFFRMASSSMSPKMSMSSGSKSSSLPAAFLSCVDFIALFILSWNMTWAGQG